jgi:hypothetical protein
MKEDKSETPTATYILLLCKENNIVYKKNALDDFAKTITELSGDEVRQDDILDLIIALKRNGIISNKDVVKLVSQHLREVKKNG